MSLKKCKECGQQISSEAKTCPHCGAKKRRSAEEQSGHNLCLFVIVFGGLALIYQLCLLQSRVEKEVKLEAASFARKSFEETSIVYKKIGGVRKESFLKFNYKVTVVADIPDHNDIVLTLEIEGFEGCLFPWSEGYYEIRWDTRSAAILVLYKIDKEIRQITR